MDLLERLGNEKIDTIIHVGAHYGEELHLYESLRPKSVVWIEADPSLCQILEERIKASNSQAKQICVNALISNEDNREIEFYRFNNEGGSSSIFHSTPLLKSSWEGLAETGEVLRMPTQTLATALKSLGVKPNQVDIIVIDAQGSELLCLEGLGEYGDYVKWIDVECSQEEIYACGALFPEVNQYLYGMGFRRISGIPWHGNCLYKRIRWKTDSMENRTSDLATANQYKPRSFAGLASIIPNSYKSQCGQDYWIHKKYFRDKPRGVFVDVGANNGIDKSSTYFFEKNMGWSGVCIEPNPSCFSALYENRSCTILPCAISGSLGISEFYQVTGDLSVLSSLAEYCDPRHLDRIRRETQYSHDVLRSTSILQVPLSLIFNDLQLTAVDFLKIDVEGAELAVLESINWSAVKISIIEIEDNYGDAETHDFLREKGYVLDAVFDSFVYVYAHRDRFFEP
jgi:FkbM family methyltransferase